ncbi:DUF305 domain-containing protein [Arthrobacter sp. D2-10]
MQRYLSLPAVALAAVVVLSGCGSTGSRPSADSQSASSAREVSASHNEADVMFAQMMIPHHQQAVEMSDMLLAKKGISPEVSDLATSIREAQAPEMDTMAGWLKEWDEPADLDDGMEGHHMGAIDGTGGMLSEEEMADLEAAQGDEAARTFLKYMTAHHIGAVDMAREEIKKGENAEAVALAEAIAETQKAEVQEMKDLLAGL